MEDSIYGENPRSCEEGEKMKSPVVRPQSCDKEYVCKISFIEFVKTAWDFCTIFSHVERIRFILIKMRLGERRSPRFASVKWKRSPRGDLYASI